jgi:nitroreductase
MDNTEIVAAAQNRRSIKTFDQERIILDPDFDVLLEVARQSPSAFGLEPWRIKVVHSLKVREDMKLYVSGGRRQIETCSHFVVFTIMTSLLSDSTYFEDINKNVKGFDDEEHAVFVPRLRLLQEQKLGLTDERSRIDWAGKQAYIALGNMLLASAICGIDSCAIEGFASDKIDLILAEHNLIEKDREHVAVMVAFGYRDIEPARDKTRRATREIVRYIY